MNATAIAAMSLHQAHANDSEPNYRGGLPALHWLAKTDPLGALAVQHQIRTASTRTSAEPRATCGSDDHDGEGHSIPDAPISFDSLVEPAAGTEEVAPELLHQESPNERDLLTALGWKEWPTSSRRSEPVGWSMRAPARSAGSPFSWTPTDGSAIPANHRPNETAQIGGLIFYTRPEARRGRAGGMLISFASGGRRPQRPLLATDKQRGGKRPYRSKSGVESYLALKGRFPSPLAAETHRRPMSSRPAGGDYYSPLAGVAATRTLLEALGVDGSVPFADLPLGTRGPARTARGARFIAGIVGSKETATMPSPTWQEPRTELSDVLDEVAARGTLKSIGLRLGYRGGYADRAGKRALLAEAKALVAANENEGTAARDFSGRVPNRVSSARM